MEGIKMIRVKGYTFDAHTPPVPYELDFNMKTITEVQDFLKEQKFEYYMFIWEKIKKD